MTSTEALDWRFRYEAMKADWDTLRSDWDTLQAERDALQAENKRLRVLLSNAPTGHQLGCPADRQPGKECTCWQSLRKAALSPAEDHEAGEVLEEGMAALQERRAAGGHE